MKKENCILKTVKGIQDDIASGRYTLKEKILDIAQSIFAISFIIVIITLLITKIIYLLPIAVIGTFFALLGGLSYFVVLFLEM